MLAVLGAIEELDAPTLSNIAEALGFGRTSGVTVKRLIEQAGVQAGVMIERNAMCYRITSWGIVIRRDGALDAWRNRANRPRRGARKM